MFRIKQIRTKMSNPLIIIKNINTVDVVSDVKIVVLYICFFSQMIYNKGGG